ncbi:sensor histidine kinase [Dyella sp.]|uniref:sensor histidine kinase n=1 Tax=Dyella sp. TaxID=1869338 RepID=UPI002B463D4D|nr:sensor histidine kinase [Dyella sp.]HKT27434.1 sensor histidine kinase [Dyella sp.]
MSQHRRSNTHVLQRTGAQAEPPPVRKIDVSPLQDVRRFLLFTALRERWRTALASPNRRAKADTQETRFQREVRERLGVLPHFFLTASAAPGLGEQLWVQAKAAYLDSPLPSLFKERLFVHLSRFCEMRYCIVRHVGFLLGRGHPAGDAKAAISTIDQVLQLLSRPVPNAAHLEAVLARLEGHAEPAPMPAPCTRDEQDLFDALTVMFVVPARSAQARAAVKHAVGSQNLEYLLAFLAFVRQAHYWTETHPQLEYEADMIMLMAKRRDLARRLLDTSDAEWAHAGDALREALTGQMQVLNTELQHRTRNLLSVIRVLFDRTLSKHTRLDGFAEVFSARLDAINRAQVYLSRLVQGEKVTFDGLLRNELAAHAVSLQQITLDGPAGVRLRSSALQTFALALHELVVNAVKYGALAYPSARLSVRWDVEHVEGQPSILHVFWQETGVPVLALDEGVVQPGYGRELIERALPYQLKAKTQYELLPEGVRCSMSVPVLG